MHVTGQSAQAINDSLQAQAILLSFSGGIDEQVSALGVDAAMQGEVKDRGFFLSSQEAAYLAEIFVPLFESFQFARLTTDKSRQFPLIVLILVDPAAQGGEALPACHVFGGEQV